ncbi:MAG TPA: hypothetical protein VG838_09775 [Opitutaceae bacterium]|nr:hypothetical protein [Opitutaceae bacterium]
MSTGGETPAHRRLKRLALAWAQAGGFPLGAFEVAVPRSGFRADVAAATMRVAAETGRVAVFECKQARSDWLGDAANEAEARRLAIELDERVRRLRELVAVHRPDLRRGESLFAEFDAYDYRGLRHDTLHALERQLRLQQRRLGHAVKFDRLGRYACCNLRYVVTEPGIAEPHEIPVGWGWLVRADDRLVLRVKPVLTECPVEARLALLERIARAGTRLFGAGQGSTAANPEKGVSHEATKLTKDT